MHFFAVSVRNRKNGLLQIKLSEPVKLEVTNDYSSLRNRLPVGGGCVYVLQMFFLFSVFLFFFHPSKIWDNRSRERLNGFSWNFYQTIRGKCSLKRRAAAWRKSCRRLAKANVDDLRNLRYDSFAITRGRHARRLRYTTMSGRIDVI